MVLAVIDCWCRRLGLGKWGACSPSRGLTNSASCSCVQPQPRVATARMTEALRLVLTTRVSSVVSGETCHMTEALWYAVPGGHLTRKEAVCQRTPF